MIQSSFHLLTQIQGFNICSISNLTKKMETVPSISSITSDSNILRRVMGGKDASPNEFPYLVHISYNNQFNCGGTILNTLFILTAAHCVESNLPSRYRIIAGDHNRGKKEGSEQIIKVAKIIPHLGYNSTTTTPTFEHDIALLKLSTGLKFNPWVQPIAYPKVGKEYKKGKAWLIGWGKKHFMDSSASNKLQKVEVPFVSNWQCGRLYERKLGEGMICAGTGTGRATYGVKRGDACPGDSGGPLTCDKEVCGIVSHGVKCGGFYHLPGVYTNVSHYGKWIQDTIQANENKVPS